MVFYLYTCPDCGMIVRTDHSTVQLLEIKTCGCPSVPVESIEDIPE